MGKDALIRSTTKSPDPLAEYTAKALRILKNTCENIIELSGIAHEVHEKFGYARYVAWVEQDLGISETFGRRMLNVFDAFGTANLAVPGSMAVSALYLLSAPSTPETARRQALEKMDSGETVSHREAKELIEAHREIERLKDENRILQNDYLDEQGEKLREQGEKIRRGDKITLLESRVRNLKDRLEKAKEGPPQIHDDPENNNFASNAISVEQVRIVDENKLLKERISELESRKKHSREWRNEPVFRAADGNLHSAAAFLRHLLVDLRAGLKRSPDIYALPDAFASEADEKLREISELVDELLRLIHGKPPEGGGILETGPYGQTCGDTETR